jgi:putative acetyltransferase
MMDRFALPDGRLVILRPPMNADAGPLWVLERDLVADGPGMVVLPDELQTPAELAVSLASRLAGGLDFERVVEADGQLLGHVVVRRPPRRMIAHNGTLSIGVHPNAQGFGLGRRLMAATIAWAAAGGVARIDLFVRGDNPRAIALYRAFGFETVEARAGFVRLPDGRALDDLHMAWRAPAR